MQLQARLTVAVLAGLASLTAAPAFAAKADSAASLRAKDMLSSAGIAAPNDAFVVRDVIVDRDGTEHVRFDRTFRGLPVIGGDVVVHSKNGKFASASRTLKTKDRPLTKATRTADDALLAAGADFGGQLNDIGYTGLVVYARGAKPVLAHEVRVRGVSKTQGEADIAALNKSVDALETTLK